MAKKFRRLWSLQALSALRYLLAPILCVQNIVPLFIKASFSSLVPASLVLRSGLDASFPQSTRTFLRGREVCNPLVTPLLFQARIQFPCLCHCLLGQTLLPLR